MLQNEICVPYIAVHNATANPENGYLHQYAVDYIANFATAPANDHEAITQLVTTVARLTTELVTVNEKLVIALHKNAQAAAAAEGATKTSMGGYLEK